MMFNITNTVCEADRALHGVSHYKHGVRGLETYMMFHFTNTVCEADRPLHGFHITNMA